MKRLILSSLVCFLSLGLFAQIEIEVISETQYDLQADLTDFYSEPVLHSWVVNKSNQTIQLRWLLETPTDCPSDWKYKVCDKNQCYSSNVTSNVVAGGQPNAPAVIAPGDSSIIDLHINPRLVAGCCVPTIRFSDVTDPNNEIQLGSQDYSVCISALSSVNEAFLQSLRAFPNPTTGQFTITDNPLVKKLVVYNLLGKQIASFQHQNGSYHDLSSMPSGLYLVSMQDENGELLKTVRMTKQEVRP